MFDELWVIKNGLCISNTLWGPESLTSDPQLLAAFLEALTAFQVEALPNEQLNRLEFRNRRLMVYQNQKFLLAVAESSQKPVPDTLQS